MTEAALRYPEDVTGIGDVGDLYVPPLPRVSVQAFCDTPGVSQILQDAARDRRMAKTHFQLQMGGAAAAAEFYVSAPTPNVIVLETRAPRDSLLGDLEKLAEVCDAGTKVIVVGHVNDVDLYRELIKRGVSEYLVAPISVMDCLAAWSGLFAGQAETPLGRTFAFVGAKGGVGASTVAHNVAWAMSRNFATETVISDLDLAFGTAGLDFNQDPPQGIADAVFSPERLDDVFLDRLLSRCSEKLSLLAAPSTLDRVYDFGESAFDPVVDILRSTVPAVVLDLPHVWTSWARSLLTTADEIVVVAAPDLANLRNAKNLVDMLKTARPNDRAPWLVLNGSGLAKRPEIKAGDFASAIGLDPVAVIPFDAQLFGTASNNGQMVAETSSSAKPAEIFVEIAKHLLGKTEPRKARGGPLAPILARLRRKA